MDLGHPIETIVQYLLIRGMIYLDRQDKFPMLSTLACMITQWIRPTMNHHIRLLSCHDSPSYYVT